MVLTRLLLVFTAMFISHLSSNTVSSDTIQPTAITVQKGHPVHLAIQKRANETSYDLEWLKDNLDIVVSYDLSRVNIHPSYRERVDFNTGNYSLTLKNVQETDRGLYTARASGDSITIIGLYNVTVGIRSHGTTASVSLTWIIFLVLFSAII